MIFFIFVALQRAYFCLIKNAHCECKVTAKTIFFQILHALSEVKNYNLLIYNKKNNLR